MASIDFRLDFVATPKRLEGKNYFIFDLEREAFN